MRGVNPLDHPVCLSPPLRLTASGWLEHIPFGMFVVDVLRPRIIVELGAHTGVSYCAFCQAVRELGTATLCYAVDTWQGDPQAGFYEPDVLGDLRAHHDPLYGGFSRLVRGTFDEAVEHFEDGTIDLLHLDGCHTYEAVRHDFDTWQPKLSDRGVALLHDINVRERDFGVWKLWTDLRDHYPHFEFHHGHGLGVLAVGHTCPEGIRPLLQASQDEAAPIREVFCELGQRLTLRWERDLARQRIATLATSRDELAERTQELEELLAQERQHIEAESQQAREYAARLEARIGELEELQQQLATTVRTLDAALRAANPIKNRLARLICRSGPDR